MRIRAAIGMAGAAILVVISVLFAPVGAVQAAAPAIPCRATATVVHPHQNQTVPVYVSTAPSARISGIAYYKTTHTAKNGIASTRGNKYLYWRISHATIGFQVNIVVTVTSGSLHGSCVTSFTPVA
jgi:hypothetical protein